MLIKIKASPKAKVNSVVKITDTEYQVRTTAAPDKNKANQKIIELLSRELGVPQARVKIVQGAKSRRKTIEI